MCFYRRQFITRNIYSHHIANRLQGILAAYFQGGMATKQGLPTAGYLAGQLNTTPSYLDELLKIKPLA